MTTALAAPAATEYLSGFCGYSGFHDYCRSAFCACTCHSPELLDNDVNDGRLETPTKDTPKDATNASGAPASPSSTYLHVTDAVATLSRDVASILDDLHEIQALDLLSAVREARQELAQIESVVEGRAAKLMSGKVVEWPGGVAERRYGKDRKQWQHDELIRTLTNLIASAAACDTTSGEVDEMLAALIHDAIDQFAKTHRPDWRVTALKQLGVDPDEYCVATPGPVSVQITAAGAQ